MAKDINVKTRSYYFFNDMIAFTNFDEATLKVNKKNYEHIAKS